MLTREETAYLALALFCGGVGVSYLTGGVVCALKFIELITRSK